jgi:hypothetical protein
MTLDMVTRVIGLIVAPVVMVTSCAILVGGMLTRYGAVNDRLRLLARERFDLLRGSETGTASPVDHAFSRERLAEIDRQIPDLLRRHRMIRDAILAVYLAIATFVATMFAIALAVVVGANWLGTFVLLTFLAGTAELLFAVVVTTREVRASQQAVAFEVKRVLSLTADSLKGDTKS